MVPRAVVWRAVVYVCLFIGILEWVYLGGCPLSHASADGPWGAGGFVLGSVLVGGSIALTLAKLLPRIQVRNWLRPFVWSAVGATLAPLQAWGLLGVLLYSLYYILPSSLPDEVNEFVGGFVQSPVCWGIFIAIPYGALFGIIMPYMSRLRAGGTSQP